ncbi:MAG: MarR family winged helix-turn-helix transcriptional regulator [Micromonosporaceae bacterium]
MPARPNRSQLLAEVIAEAPRQAGAIVRLNIAIGHQLGMALADLQCMRLLSDKPSTPSQLAAQLGLTTGAMTKVLDRLQNAGFITRSADPSDRRRIIIAADPAGLAELAGHFGPMGDQMSAYLSRCTRDELETILEFMRAGREAADEQITRIRRGGIRHATRRPRGAATR